jgi:hypothetical protein
MFNILQYFMIYFQFDNTFLPRTTQMSRQNPGSISVIQDYESRDTDLVPDPKEIITEPQQCFPLEL